MRQAAAILSAVVLGASLITATAYGVLLRWESSGQGRQVMAGMAVVCLLFAAVRYQYTSWPGKDLVMACVLLLVLPVAVLRLVSVLRRPPGP